MKMKKAQDGIKKAVKKVAPKMMAGEMTGKMYKKSEIDAIGDKQAKELDKSGVFGKAAMAKKKTPKAEKGGAFGMLSVKAGIDKNPNPTQADRIAGAKKMAKSGKSLAKQAAIAIAMKKAGKAPKKASYGKMMKGGGKCKNGC
jgi:hypothetical protein